MKKKIAYRKDIDGLRAVAVLGVILYHSEISIGENLILSGGFLGVDVFFVISGYLITSIIYQEFYYKKNFSFLNFYERRLRRLIPALLFVLITSVIFAYFLLLPVQFKAYLDTLLSSIFFYSNLYFHYSGQAYGEMVMSTQPLLHTWSLSVEEQFYIFYPILLITLLTFFKNKIKLFFYISVITSIIFATYINHDHASFSFYMIFTRAWELVCGGLIALKHFEDDKKKEYKGFWKILGLFLIIFSFIFFDATNNHPSYLTLLPVVGCCLVIENRNKNSISNRILTNQFLVTIGLISYSLYLWHHPILSFGKISGLTENNIFLKILLIFISFGLSLFTYFFVEKKFRDKKIINFKQLISIILPLIIFLIFLTITLPEKQKKNYPKILQDLYNQTWFTTKQFYKPCFQRKQFFCNFGDKTNKQTVFLVGGSVMASIQDELKNELSIRKINFIPMTNAGCDFVKQHKKNKQSVFCNSKLQIKRDKEIRQYKNSTIIMHLNYRNIGQGNEKLDSFVDNIAKYLNLNYNIILIYPIPQWPINVSQKIFDVYSEDKKNFLENFKLNKYISSDYKDYLFDTKKITNKFNKLSNKNLFSVYPDKVFCNIIENNKCTANSSENIFFIDNSHLSKKGSEMINLNLIKIIDKIYSVNSIN